MRLNTQSAIPLYRQLAERIRADIDTGKHAVATRIPSENEMAERYAIGRPTVRQATDLLVRQGLLERRRGSGTFVLPPSKSIDLFSLAGTSAALQKSELDSRLVLVRGPVRESGDAVSVASTASGESARDVNGDRLRIERQAIVDGVPVLYETLWFDAQLFAGLEKQTIEDRSLSAIVREVFYLELTSADQVFVVITADDQRAQQLSVDVGTPLLRVQRVLHFGDQRSVLHAEIVCRTDCFAFSQTLYPAQAGQDEFVETTTTNRG